MERKGGEELISLSTKSCRNQKARATWRWTCEAIQQYCESEIKMLQQLKSHLIVLKVSE